MQVQHSFSFFGALMFSSEKLRRCESAFEVHLFAAEEHPWSIQPAGWKVNGRGRTTKSSTENELHLSLRPCRLNHLFSPPTTLKGKKGEKNPLECR